MTSTRSPEAFVDCPFLCISSLHFPWSPHFFLDPQPFPFHGLSRPFQESLLYVFYCVTVDPSYPPLLPSDLHPFPLSSSFNKRQLSSILTGVSQFSLGYGLRPGHLSTVPPLVLEEDRPAGLSYPKKRTAIGFPAFRTRGSRSDPQINNFTDSCVRVFPPAPPLYHSFFEE